MKLPLTTVRTVLWLGVAALAACGGADTGPVVADWHVNYAEARQLALQTHRLMFVAFMGSDWSGPCQVIKKEVLDTPVFKNFSDANLVLAMADFPRNAPLSADIAKQNADLAKGVSLDRLPAFLLVDPRNNSAFNKIQNYSGGPDQFVAQIQSGIEQYQQALQNSARAASAAPAATPAALPPPSGPSFSQPAPTQPATSPMLPSFPGSLPSPDELMRRQQQSPSRPQ